MSLISLCLSPTALYNGCQEILECSCKELEGSSGIWGYLDCDKLIFTLPWISGYLPNKYSSCSNKSTCSYVGCQNVFWQWQTIMSVHVDIPDLKHWGLLTNMCHWSGLPLVQVMTCCLFNTSQYLNQCWLFLSSIAMINNSVNVVSNINIPLQNVVGKVGNHDVFLLTTAKITKSQCAVGLIIIHGLCHSRNHVHKQIRSPFNMWRS